MKFDLIVIGAGPAGVSAAIYAKSRGINVAILEKNKVGGLIGNVSTVTHYLGIIENETGKTFASRLENQAISSGIKIIYEDIKEINLSDKKIETNKNTYESKAVILANGTTMRKLNIPGEDEFTGKGMRLNAARDGQNYKDKNVYVVGGADGAIKEALYLSQFAKNVTIIHFEQTLGCIDEFKQKLSKSDNIKLKLGTRLTAVMGADKVNKLELLNVKTNEKEIITDNDCGVFVYAGTIPNTEIYKELELKDGFIPVNDNMETKIPGIYAAGDIRVKQVRQVATAVADGTVAGINACSYITR